MYNNKEKKATKTMSKNTRKLIKLSAKDIVIGIVNLYLFYKYGKSSSSSEWQIVLLIMIELTSVAAMSSQLFHLDRWKKKGLFHEYTTSIIVLVCAGILFLIVILAFLLHVY